MHPSVCVCVCFCLCSAHVTDYVCVSERRQGWEHWLGVEVAGFGGVAESFSWPLSPLWTLFLSCDWLTPRHCHWDQTERTHTHTHVSQRQREREEEERKRDRRERKRDLLKVGQADTNARRRRERKWATQTKWVYMKVTLSVKESTCQSVSQLMWRGSWYSKLHQGQAFSLSKEESALCCRPTLTARTTQPDAGCKTCSHERSSHKKKQHTQEGLCISGIKLSQKTARVVGHQAQTTGEYTYMCGVECLYFLLTHFRFLFVGSILCVISEVLHLLIPQNHKETSIKLKYQIW